MMFEKYKEFIDQYVSLNSIEWQNFKSALKVHDYKKGEIIHRSGDVCTKLFFINHGLIRGYVIDTEGKEYTWNLFFNDADSVMTNVYVVDYESFVSKSRSKITFEVLEDCQLISITYEKLNTFYKGSLNSEKLGRIMAEIAYSSVHNAVLDQITKTATERYEELVKKHPHYIQKIPQYHIASYLGITPQSLSRIKKSLDYPM